MSFSLNTNQQKISKRKKLKQAFSIFLAGFFPFFGALFKTLAWSFGTLNFINFFYLGTIALSASSFTGIFFPLVCVFGLSVFAVTLFVEDRSVYQVLQVTLDHFLGLQEEENLDQSSDNIPTSKWQKKFNYVAANCIRTAGIALAITTAAIKGMAAAAAIMVPLYGCYAISTGLTISVIGVGSLISLGPPGWVILSLGILAGVSLATNSLLKEGRACYGLTSKFADWLTYTPKPRHSRWKHNAKETIESTYPTKIRTPDPELESFLRWKQTKWPDKPAAHLWAISAPLRPAKNYRIEARTEEILCSTPKPGY